MRDLFLEEEDDDDDHLLLSLSFEKRAELIAFFVDAEDLL